MKALFAGLFSAMLLPQTLLAQDPFDGLTPPGRFTIFSLGPTAGQLLLAILCGVVLALGFQWVLTNLSLAIGISALEGKTSIRKREETRRKSLEKSSRERAEHGPHELKKEPRETEWEDTAIKIESGVGIWAMITSALALFFACWLSVELIRIQSGVQAGVLGLVIWSVFMGSMLYLEKAAASSLLGYITGAVRNGIGTLFAPLKAAAGRISDGRAQSARREEARETAEEIAGAVRREMFGEEEPEGPGIKDKLRQYVDSGLKPKVADAESMAMKMKSVLTDPELVEAAKRGELQDLDKSRFAEIVAGRTDLSREQADRLAEALHSTWGRFIMEHAAPVAGVAASVAPLVTSSGSGAPSRGLREKYQQFKEFLRSTGREELRPERLETAIKTLVQDPGAGLEQLKEFAGDLDRDSVAQALSRRQDLSPEEANRIADQIDMARSRALSAREEAEHRAQETRDRAMSRIRDQVYSVDRPELDFEGFQGDFRKLFEDPKAGFEALKARLQGIDRETIISILSSREGVTREDAEKMVSKGESIKAKAEQTADKAKSGMDEMADRILQAKEAALERARQAEEEIKRRLAEAKRQSLEQAEATRKVTAAAAWWLLAIAVVSGAAAALGALTAVLTT